MPATRTPESPQPGRFRRSLTRLAAVITTTALVTASAALLTAVPAHADPAATTTTIAGITYTIDPANTAAGATVTSYDRYAGTAVTVLGSVAIPSGGPSFPVTALGARAFESTGLSSVTLPDSLTSIGYSSFSSNPLTQIDLPAGLTTIGDFAFNWNKLTELTLPNGVTTVGYGAFLGNQIATLTLPASLTTLTESAFEKNLLTSVTIPPTVVEIGTNAFAHNLLTTVTVPNSVTSIGDSAFEANRLTSVELGNSVETIWDSAFSNNALESVTIPASVELIGSWAFGGNSIVPYEATVESPLPPADTSTLTDVIFLGPPPGYFLPTSDTTSNPGDAVPDYDYPSLGAGFGLTVHYPAVYQAPGFASGFRVGTWQGYATSVLNYSTTATVSFDVNGHGTAIPSQLVALGKPVTAPSESPSAPNWTFTGWYRDAAATTKFDFSTPITADTVLYAGWTQHGVTVDGMTFEVDLGAPKAGATLVSYENGSPAAVTIPARVTIHGTTYAVTTIGDAAFVQSDITAVRMPESVTTIGDGAFGMNQLTAVTIPGSVTTIGDFAFAYNTLHTVTLGRAVQSIGVAAFSLNGDMEAWGGDLENYTAEWSTLQSVVFTGPAPTNVIGADGDIGDSDSDELSEANPIYGSFGPALDLVISYPVAFGAKPGTVGFTAPNWQGYSSQAIASVTFNLKSHGTAIAKQTVTVGAAAKQPTTPKATGYVFTGWFTDSAATAKPFVFSTTKITANTTLYAGWKKAVAVSFNLKSHGKAITKQTIATGTVAKTPTKPTASGYVFTGWFTDSAPTAKKFNFSTKLTKSTTLYAGWKKAVAVSFTLNGHGSAITKQTIATGAVAKKPTNPKATGYVFTGWFTDKAATKTPFSFSKKITANTVLYAGWKKK